VEKFGAAKIQNESQASSLANSTSPPLTEKWVTVSPRKRGRSFPSSRKMNPSKLSPVPASPTVKLVNAGPSFANVQGVGSKSSVLGSIPDCPADGHKAETNSTLAPPAELPNLVANSSTLAELVTTAADQPGLPLIVGPGPGIPAEGSPVHSSPASPFTGSIMEDDDVDMLLNFEPEEEIQMSPDSSKKRKLALGEASSPSSSIN